MITLLDGRTISQSSIFFHPDTYKFTADSGEDLTYLISFADKKKFDGFDGARWLTIVSDLQRTGAIQPPLNTSTASIFWEQLTTDPLAAPLESANNVFNEVLNSAVAPKIGLAVAAVVGILVLIFFIKES